MSAGIPMGFLLVVGFSVVLLAALQVLLVAWVIDLARVVRRTAVVVARPEPLQLPRPPVQFKVDNEGDAD